MGFAILLLRLWKIEGKIIAQDEEIPDERRVRPQQVSLKGIVLKENQDGSRGNC